MEIYQKLFEVLFPVFFVVGIGYYLGKKNPKIDTTFITNFAANVGTPAMIIYALTSTGTTFELFKNYFWYYLIAIVFFGIIGIIFLFFLNTKDIIRELPPFIMPNTGNMGLPICLFAYGSQGLGVAAAISALIIYLPSVNLISSRLVVDELANSPFASLMFTAESANTAVALSSTFVCKVMYPFSIVRAPKTEDAMTTSLKYPAYVSVVKLIFAIIF